jgi:hypothetical protein
MTPTEQQAVISLMFADGVRWLRVDVPSNFPYDVLIRDAVAAGMQVDALIVDWNTADTPASIAGLSTQVVTHLEPMGVETYEVLNEVNGRMTAATYTPILQAAYQAIKAVDQNATVLTSGLMPGEGAIAPAAYLATMYQDGAKGYFDDVAVHPYSYPQMPLQPDDWNTFYDLSNVRQVMVANGDSAKKIWLTEFGCPQITQAYGQANAWGWIGQLFIYSWQDDNVSGDGDFGLYYSNGAPKAASLAAYQQAVA